jgi:hypothetical protein
MKNTPPEKIALRALAVLVLNLETVFYPLAIG